MTWTLDKQKLDWPAELNSATYKKHDKNEALKVVLNSLDDAKKFADGIDVPQEWSSKNPKSQAIWKEQIDKLINGDLKKLAASMDVVAKRCEKAGKDISVQKSKDLPTVVKTILKAVNTASASVQPAALKAEAARLEAEGEKIQVEFLKKQLGGTITAFKAVAAKGHPKLDPAKRTIEGMASAADPGAARAAAMEAIRQTSRDMTTNSLTLEKALNKGVVVPGLSASDQTALFAMNKLLTPISNAPSDFSGGDDVKLKAGWKTVRGQTPLFDQLAKKLTAA